MPYRQTEGLGRALAKLMGFGVAIPHHTSLAKRAAKLDIDTQLADVKGPIDVVVDSTGLKVDGEGEWKVRQHGVGKRRDWGKVHFAVDLNSHAILAELITDSRTHNATAAKPLLERVEQEIETFYGDGAYDTWPLREHLLGESIHQIIPPQKNAVIKQHGNSKNDPLERDECVRQIRRDGKAAWQTPAVQRPAAKQAAAKPAVKSCRMARSLLQRSFTLVMTFNLSCTR